MMRNPCVNCNSRWVDLINLKNCHTTCEKYKVFQEVCKRANEQRAREHNEHKMEVEAIRRKS